MLAQRSAAAASRTARCGVRFRAGLEAADGDDLVPRLDPDREGARSTPQDGVGAAVGAVERRHDAAAVQPDGVGAQQLGWQLGTGIAPKQRKSRSIQGFLKKIFTIESKENLYPYTNSLGRTIGVPKTASARGKTVSSLGCAQRLRSTKGNSSA